jgi:hypothetical protein
MHSAGVSGMSSAVLVQVNGLGSLLRSFDPIANVVFVEMID